MIWPAGKSAAVEFGWEVKPDPGRVVFPTASDIEPMASVPVSVTVTARLEPEKLEETVTWSSLRVDPTWPERVVFTPRGGELIV